MSKPTKLLAVLVALLVPFAVTSTAAQAETVTAKTKITPIGGKLKKKTRVPSKLTVSAVVKPASGAATVLPTKRIDIKFPAGMTLKPNGKVCTDKMLSPQSSLGSPKQVVAACARATVGTGTAMIYLAKNAASELRDPILVAFNAGKNAKGQPKLKIYGFSKQTGVGILMQAALKGRSLSIAVPVLAFDSAVGTFNLQLPGPVLKRPDLGLTAKGKNPRYVVASCPKSPLITNATFYFGTRDASTGQPTGPTTKDSSPATKQKCVARGR